MTRNHVFSPGRFAPTSRPMSVAPAVSFCMPCYNGVAYLRSAVASVLDQSLGNFELILVDDTSTDGTFDLACELAAQDDRIHVYRNAQNLGIVPNWNRCLELANGEWIKFIFQDDLLAPDCTARLLDAAQRQQCLFAFCERDIFLEAGIDPQLRDFFKDRLVRFSDLFPNRDYVPAEELCRMFIKHSGLNFLGEPTCALIHRSCFLRYGPFNPQLTQVCDLEYWVRLGVHEGIALVPERLATFRVHPSGTSSSSCTIAAKRFRRDVLDFLILYSSFLLDPVFQPLRESLPEANASFRYFFRAALRNGKRAFRNAGTPEELAAIRTQWDAARTRNPGIDLLRSQESLLNRLYNKLARVLNAG